MANRVTSRREAGQRGGGAVQRESGGGVMREDKMEGGGCEPRSRV